ncbi:MAG: hypothetical protein NUV98_02060 [Candidatus Roizmanbacteria bacterium]|nr:hypothetical protein [Candidatus Roizmanbacteria bacterium]
MANLEIHLPEGSHIFTPQHRGSERVIEAAGQGVIEAQSVLGQFGQEPVQAAQQLLEYVDRLQR